MEGCGLWYLYVCIFVHMCDACVRFSLRSLVPVLVCSLCFAMYALLVFNVSVVDSCGWKMAEPQPHNITVAILGVQMPDTAAVSWH